MREFWKSPPSWLKPKSWLRHDSNNNEAHSDFPSEEQVHLLPPKKSRRQTWLMGDGLRRSSKSRPASMAVDGRFGAFDMGTTTTSDAHAHAHAHARDARNKRASTYLEFLGGESSHSRGERVEVRDPTNVRYSSFFDHMVSWDRFM